MSLLDIVVSTTSFRRCFIGVIEELLVQVGVEGLRQWESSREQVPSSAEKKENNIPLACGSHEVEEIWRLQF